MMNSHSQHHRRGTHRTIAWGALAVAGSTLLAAPASADDPDVIYLTGTVRDFQKSHPDFNVDSPAGHVPNNVALATAKNHPTLTSNGFTVSKQWRSKSGQNIAPHLFHNGGSLALAGAPSYNEDDVTIDSWDSSEGTYDPDNAGPAPPIEWPAPMPAVSAPVGLPPHPNASGGNKYNHSATYSSGGTYTISSSFQCRSVSTGQNVTLEIAADSDVVLYTTNSFDLGQNSTIYVPASSSLRIYVGGGMTISQGSTINMLQPLMPSRVVITNLGSQSIDFNQTGGVCAEIVSPDGDVAFHQQNSFFGTIVAAGLSMDQGSSLHWDGAQIEVCGDLIADLAGESSGPSMAGITSAETFNEWFTDRPNVNMSLNHTIALTNDGTGVFEYLDDAFFPADHELFGNEGDAHNFNFTYAIKADFVHDQCADRFFEFHGADDVWVYIDGQLAMDLGGIMPLERQVIELDRLELEDGETYTLHFFYAQRNPNISMFRLRTDLPLESQPKYAATAPFD